MLLSHYEEAFRWSRLVYRRDYTPFVNTICHNSVHVNVIHQKDCSVISFAWTMSPSNVLSMSTSAKFMDGEVHCGLLSLYMSLKEKIAKSVHSPKIQKNVFVCGHSVGGALASFCALDLSWNYNVECLTFGCPRFASSRFQKIFRNILPKAVSVCNILDVSTWPYHKYKQAANVSWVLHWSCTPHSLSCYELPGM